MIDQKVRILLIGIHYYGPRRQEHDELIWIVNVCDTRVKEFYIINIIFDKNRLYSWSLFKCYYGPKETKQITCILKVLNSLALGCNSNLWNSQLHN